MHAMNFFRAIFSKKVPLCRKLPIVLAVLYAIFPADILPDFTPILGFLDDIAFLIATIAYFQNRIRSYVHPRTSEEDANGMTAAE